ncbi:MAG: MGMT family protein [Candidatus Aenigmarchaeota archaeon]|nr:MGMT family protein [Candidatus Aenigmarchaeota archaeon]
MKTFFEQVMEQTGRVPRGKVTTYSELSRAIGKPGAQRAVGQALKCNGRPVIIPCHRVVRSDGSLGGYGGAKESGIRKKVRLLRKEGIEVRNRKIDLKKYLHRF